MSSDEEKRNAAEKLKAEGNALHLKGDHAGARSKYTEAIALDGANAVLYANRAAAYIALKQCVAAAIAMDRCCAGLTGDGHTGFWTPGGTRGRCARVRKLPHVGGAVEIDPSYGKGWARLAKATSELHAWPVSINAWKRALGTLPDSDLTPQQKELKKQYQEGLELAQTTLKKQEEILQEGHNLQAMPNISERPWNRALEMEDVLTRTSVLNTSAWPIMNAYRDFSEGVGCMKQLKKDDGKLQGNLNAISSIIGGILRDDRVFHMDSADWLELLQLQVQFEMAAFQGWSEGGPETIKEEAFKRLEEKGWKPTRMALSATIRAWFLRAYFAHRSGESLSLALQHYNNVIDVLEWGAEKWKDVPSDDRGYIFQKTFVRAIKRLKMDAYLGAVRQSEDDSTYNVEDLIEMANQMVDETTKNVPKDEDDGPMDKGAWYSFFVYPIAEAHATLGAVFMQQGLSAKQANDTEEGENMLAAAAKFYRKAAETYPPDDEKAPFYLKIAFEAEWHRGRPLSETLALCERIGKLLPGVQKIWEFSTSSNLVAHLRQLDVFQQRAYTGLLEGRYSMETPSVREAAAGCNRAELC
ncbi:hypothetical protein TRAPUB_652 [Trametes pubescens]|uniref:TPR-like protein n=1 Tax=Trametes pubescens TaxID=154538 RepID=A0A1M2VLI8_TRAPU|nr:hypothetical protein TRAPUB_652 [Trametes pubescens]